MAPKKLLLACVGALLASALGGAAAAAGRVEELDPFTFWPAVHRKDKATFVAFYVVDCRGCKRLAPVWEDLAARLESQQMRDVAIARLDCEAAEAICERWNVERTPALKLFLGGKELVNYQAQIHHVDLLFPFLMKQRESMFGGAGGSGAQGA